VLRRHATVVLVHGCFWHGHDCARGRPPSSRREFWLPKLERNRLRDLQQRRQLRRCGWRVVTVWECQTIDEQALRRRLARSFRIR
jgi:DNA mismatch endonuclease (patch repair protein)